MKAITAIASLALNTPSRIRNSPTKLGEPGIARVASATMTNSDASTGARNAIPPMSRMSSEPPARAASRPTMKNSGATTMPWLTICRTAPCADCGASAKIPNVMKPSWATDE